MPHRNDLINRVLVLAALAWTVVLGTLWLLAPAGSTSTAVVTSTGEMSTTTSTETLLQVEGPTMLIVLAVPVALATLAVIAQIVARQPGVVLACGIALAIGCFLGMMTIGLPYVPAAATLIAAGSRGRQAATNTRQ